MLKELSMHESINDNKYSTNIVSMSNYRALHIKLEVNDDKALRVISTTPLPIAYEKDT